MAFLFMLILKNGQGFYMRKNQNNYVMTLMSYLIVICLSACASSSVTNNTIEKPSTAVNSMPAAADLNLGLLVGLIGKWRVQDWQLQKNGHWRKQAGATWTFYSIQGNTAIRDEWQSKISEDQQIPGFGSQLRVFDPLSKTWSAAWLSSRTRALEFFKGHETATEVLFETEANDKGRSTRVIFNNIQENNFNWQMQWSTNSGESWTTVYKLQATRIGE